MQIQSSQNYNSYQNPNFQKLIVRPIKDEFGNIQRLSGLEQVIRENKSIQKYADALEERAAIFGVPVTDVIIEYGNSIVHGLRCLFKTSNTMYPNLIAAEYGQYCDDSVYNQMENFDISHLTTAVKDKLQNGLMQNYLA